MVDPIPADWPVVLVGPGRAYERWKKTPEYQQWLKDTKQIK